MRSILFALLVCMSFSSFAQGKFAGVAIDGASNTGKIFRFKTDGTEVTIDKAFPNFPDGVNVVSGIFTKGPDGDLYGLTSNGGANGSGTLFKISLSEEMFVKVFDFPLAPYHGTPFGSLVAAPNGYLYGYLSRITVNAPYKSLIFRIKPDGTNYSIITEVDVIPDAPGESGLAYSASGFLYGTTFTSGASSIGSLFRIDLDGNLEVLTSFDATTGRYPVGRLIAVGGKIYGATQSSGNNKPTLFSVNENGTGLTTIHEFPSLSINSFTGLIKGPDDALYGVTTNGLTDIFRYGLDGSGYSKVFSIGHGIGKYLSFGSNNRIYGHNGASMIFSVNATGGDYTQHAVLDDWNSSNLAGLYVTTDGMVYGNGAGGNGNVGIFYKVNGNVPRNSQDAKLIKDLYSDTQGKKPLGHLTQLDDGDLLGATRMGGWNNRGTLFKIGPDGQNYRTIFDFGDVEINGYPADAPIKGPGGSYYQSTSAGDIFKINEDGTGFKRLYKANQVLFPLNDVGLLAASDGNLYGVSLNNDMPNGFLFRFNPASAGIEVIYTFNTSSIYYPQSRLIEGTDGFLYGTCFEGSTLGGVYKIKPDGSNFTVLKTFVNGLLGRSPIGDIFFGSNGKLYGYCFATTSNRQGLVFSIDADGSNYTIVHEFDPVSDRGAAIPTINGWGLITEGPGNLIYGFEPRGGTTGTGTAFNMNLDGTSYTKMELALNDHSIPLSIALGGIIFIPDKQKQTITFAELAPIENISNGHALTATASSSLAVTYTSSNTAVATISGSTVNAISEGLTVITAHQPGNGSYFAAHDVSRQLRVGKLTATAQLSSTTRGTVGGTIELTNNFDGPPELITYGVTNGTGSATLNGNVLSLTSAGTISVTIQLSGNDVYHPYSVSKEIKISKKTINPLVTSLSNGIDGSSITLQADADGSSGVITWSVQNKTGAASLADGKLNLEAAGAVIVKAEIAADDMHASGSVSQVISINSSLPDQPQIYGTMNRGGTGGEGVIYSINTDATGYRVLKDFLPSPTGAGVNQGLVTTGNGKYYGVTTYGGSENLGVIFEFDLEQNAYEVVYNFVEVGNNAHLMAGSDGMLYGVSTDGNLVILKFDPTTRVMTKIAATGMITSFFSELTEYSPGVFYGYAAMPNTKAGIYEFNSNTNTVTIRYQAGLGLDIGSGLDRLIKAPNGKMYASARSYLSFKGGIFEFDPATNGGSMKVVLNEATIGYSFSNITL
ncbi:MAG TPA: choice-of-anchor tandem repeat GloVer-containing protein, partial [Cyclobacteriaceae bacterium]|nr:choice-of-anchor tandem repeat GloVer-containing protein [Cyclobacteriaceae bacterium]